MKIKAIKKVNGFRDWVANRLVSLAVWIKPENEDVKAYWMQMYMDWTMEQMMHGKADIEIKVKKHKKNKFK